MNQQFRIWHRYLGFFLVGIMAVYAISGVVMIFRNTDFLKKEKTIEKTVAPQLSAEDLAKELKMRNLTFKSSEGNTQYFSNGSYDSATGAVRYTVKELPFVLNEMTQMHKATSDRPLFFLNIFFGISLLFFVISSFWMFIPESSAFKKGLWFVLAGIVLTLIMLWV